MNKKIILLLVGGLLGLTSCESSDAVIKQNGLPGNEFYASWEDLYKLKDNAGRSMLAVMFFDLDDEGTIIPESIVFDDMPTKTTVNNTYAVFLYGPKPVLRNDPQTEVYSMRFFKDYKLFFSVSLYNPRDAGIACGDFHQKQDELLSTIYKERLNEFMLEQLAYYKMFFPSGTLEDDEFVKGYASLTTLTIMAHPISWGSKYDMSPYQECVMLGYDDYTIIGTTPFVRNTSFAPVSDKILEAIPELIWGYYQEELE